MKNRLLHLAVSVALLLIAEAGRGQKTEMEPTNCALVGLNRGATTVPSGTTGTANGQCNAFIDNKTFPLAETKPVTATVVEPTATEGGTAKTVVDIAIAGKGEETIKLGLTLAEPVSPGATAFSASLNYNGAAYTLVKGDGSTVEITDFIWSRDRKSFMVSLNFNCTMHSAVFPEDGKRTVNLKGKLLRVRVMVPGATSASN